MNKLEPFKKELDYIKNPKILQFVKEAIETLPEYFYSIPSSSSGKYHPEYSSGDGGLVRHVRACVRIAVSMFRMEVFKNSFSEDEMDLIIVALLLHDGFKSGIEKQRYTVDEHPILMSNYLKENKNWSDLISENYLNKVADGILTHMGEWNKDKSGNPIMPKPTGKLQKYIHMCDYLGSRKCIIMDFDAEVKRE